MPNGLPRSLQLQLRQLRASRCAALLLSLLLLLVAEIPTTTANQYCSITCRGELHTMCIYPAGPGANCSAYRPDPLSPPERAAVLHKHNELRSRMALGQVPPYPPASDMMEMAWDEELTQIAQRWADQCSFRHDKCRNSQRFAVGQNLAVYYTNGPGFPAADTRVQSWYDEISLYAYAPGPFRFATDTGHFTQVVWGSTNLLGCARSRYNIGNFVHQLLVCNYGPGGNTLGRPLYTSGMPCSQCSCSARYPGLCAVGSTVANDLDSFSFADYYFRPSPTTQTPPFTYSYSTTPPASLSYYTTLPKQSNLIIQPRYTQATTTSRPTTKPAARTTLTPKPAYQTYYQTTPVINRSGFQTTQPTKKPSYYQTTSVTKKPTYPTTYYQTTPTTSKPSYQTTQPTKKPTYQTYYQTTQATKRPTYQTSYYQTTPATTRPASQTYYQTTPATKKPAATTAVTRRSLPTTTAPPTTTATASATLLPLQCPLPVGPGPACGADKPAPLPLSASDRAALLRLHNKRRAELARGGLPGFPSAADMRQLVWDDELAEMAQRWADQCIWGHDPCRKTSRFEFKGQNIALSYGANEAVEQRALEWFDEARLFQFRDAPFQFALNTSHFSQMAWADTAAVGCARARFPFVASDANLLVCNYGPSGNVEGANMYTPGPACSRCASGCSAAYPSLCAPTLAESTTVAATISARSQQSQSANEVDAAPVSVPVSVPVPVAPFKSATCPRKKGPGAACGDKYRPSPLSAGERQALLDAHNELRNRVASGSLKKMPSAANMNQLEWDDKLAEFAQNWADQCTLGFDACAVTDSYTAGQNMAIWYSHDLDTFPPPEQRVQGWFDEMDNYNYTNGLFAFNAETAALTQLLWAATRKLGCGRSRFMTRATGVEVAAEFLVCDYGPGGNILNARLYQTGPPCSKCQQGNTCSPKWPALCARSTNS